MKDQIKDVAHLARLKIDEKNIQSFQDNFNKVLNYFNVLSEVDTQGVEPMVTPHGIQPTLREDEVKQDLGVAEVLENGPDVKDSLFKVPPVV